MQTFLPVPDFWDSARALDRQRLGKQRVEVLQILKALNGGGGWANHPCTRMWRGHTQALVDYGLAVCGAWIARGYRDTCYEKIAAYSVDDRDTDRPPWLGDARFHAAHRSNLVRKNPEYYLRLWPGTAPDLEYVWPV